MAHSGHLHGVGAYPRQVDPTSFTGAPRRFLSSSPPPSPSTATDTATATSVYLTAGLRNSEAALTSIAFSKLCRLGQQPGSWSALSLCRAHQCLALVWLSRQRGEILSARLVCRWSAMELSAVGGSAGLTCITVQRIELATGNCL